MHRRRDPAGPQEARRVPGLRRPVHAGAPAGRADGVVRGGLRRLLPLREDAMTTATLAAGPVCPVPLADYPTVQLAHGGGGRLSQRLIEGMFVPAFANPALADARRRRGARPELASVLTLAGGGRLAFSTDSFVVRPLFFPGGDIGSLAVHGTVNDLAMCGARPLAISAGFILEEGFPMDDLWRVVSLDARRGARGGRAGGHRRHQGGRPRQGGRHLHQHDGHRLDRPTASRSARGGARPGDVVLLSGGHGRARHRHHVGARGARVRNRDRERLGRAARAGGRSCSNGWGARCTCCATRPAAGWRAR